MTTEAKEIIFGEEALQHLKVGVDTLTKVVGYTLGPKGRNAAIEKSWGAPKITNDGSSIVTEIELKETAANLGVSLGKELAQKMKESCGDGTSTATLLFGALVNEGIKQVCSGTAPNALKRGMEKGLEEILKNLDKLSIPIKNQDDIRNIATVSASGNTEIGQIIAQAIEKVGLQGVITIEEAKTTETTIEVVEGMQLERGYLSSHLCTNRDKMQVVYENVKVLLYDKKISNIHELLPILQVVAATRAPLLIIAEDIEGDALSTLVVNKLRGALQVAAIKAPGFGDRRKAILEDLAALTGATLISQEMGLELANAKAEHLGEVGSLTITKEHTTLINGKGKKEAIVARIKIIEAEAERASSSYDKEKAQERKAKLGGGVAVIRVGAATEPELKERKQRFEDSLNSTKAAIESGIVAGGGVALIRAAEQTLTSLKLSDEEATGLRVLQRACQMPLKQIANNSGEDGSVIVQKVLAAKPHFGFNAITGDIEDLLKAGVIDPVKVVKNAIVLAVSMASVILITRALIINAKEEEIEE